MLKSLKEIIEFVEEKRDEADDLNLDDGDDSFKREINAYNMILQYLESKTAELTPEELTQMKDKVKKVPIVKVNAVDIIESLPQGANPDYDIDKGYTVFFLNQDKKLDFQVIGDPSCRFLCPLLQGIALKDLIKIRENVKKSIISGTIEGSNICDGGDERGRGLFFVTVNGTIMGYNK